MRINKRAVKQINERIKAKAELIGEIINSAAVALTPVDLGNLKQSNDYRCVDTGKSLTVYNYNYADYASFVELGTGIYTNQPGANKDGWVYPFGDESDPEFRYTEGQKPQPFLYPAFVNSINKIKRIMKK